MLILLLILPYLIISRAAKGRPVSHVVNLPKTPLFLFSCQYLFGSNPLPIPHDFYAFFEVSRSLANQVSY